MNPTQILTFNFTGEDFSGYVAACNWLTENGYSFGSMQASAPIGIIKGKHYLIQKWKDLSNAQRSRLDGTMEFPYGSPRTSAAVVKLKG